MTSDRSQSRPNRRWATTYPESPAAPTATMMQSAASEKGSGGMRARNQTGQTTPRRPTGRANQAPSPGNRRNSQRVRGAKASPAARETTYQRNASSNQDIPTPTNRGQQLHRAQ